MDSDTDIPPSNAITDRALWDPLSQFLSFNVYASTYPQPSFVPVEFREIRYDWSQAEINGEAFDEHRYGEDRASENEKISTRNLVL